MKSLNLLMTETITSCGDLQGIVTAFVMNNCKLEESKKCALCGEDLYGLVQVHHHN